MAKPYAIFSFRNEGPLKSWGEVRNAQIHNSREKPIAHAVNDAQPVHIIGQGRLVHDIQATLRRHGIDPSRMRKNGVIAYEAVLTASPAFFHGIEAGAGAARFRDWCAAQKAFVLTKWGPNRVVSLVCHQDETTIHMHAVILPLVYRRDSRLRDASLQWALVGRSIAGPGEYDRVQNEYARAMEPFGLSRGEVKSGRKHKPVKDYLADLRAQEDANRKRAAELQEELRTVRDASLRAEVERRALGKEKRALIAVGKAQAEEQSRLDAERLAIAGDRQAFRDMLARIAQVRQLAGRFMEMAKQVPPSQWTPEALRMATAAQNLNRACALAPQPEDDLELQRAWLAQMGGKGR